MKVLTAKEAAEFCKQNKFKKSSWDCGYAMEVYLELDCGIKLASEDAWVELENLLYYEVE